MAFNLRIPKRLGAMSYCRFSTDNFRCDLYVYESMSGIEIWVASFWFVESIPELPSVSSPSFDAREWEMAFGRQLNHMQRARRQPFRNKYAGKHYLVTHTEALCLLLRLRQAGYRYPESVVDEILQEVLSDE